MSANNLSRVLEGELLFNKWLIAKDDVHVERAKMLFKNIYNDIADCA